MKYKEDVKWRQAS